MSSQWNSNTQNKLEVQWQASWERSRSVYYHKSKYYFPNIDDLWKTVVCICQIFNALKLNFQFKHKHHTNLSRQWKISKQCLINLQCYETCWIYINKVTVRLSVRVSNFFHEYVPNWKKFIMYHISFHLWVTTICYFIISLYLSWSIPSTTCQYPN